MLTMSLVVVVLLVSTAVQAQAGSPTDAKKIENLEKQVQILSNLVHAQSSIMAKFSCQSGTSTTSSASECLVKVANQAKTIQKLQSELTALDSSSKTQDSQIKQLHSSVKDLSNKVTAQGNELTKVDTKFLTRISTLNSEIGKLDQKRNVLENNVKQLGTKVQQLSGTWPSGKYCILASGPCPPGFTRSSGHMRAISLYSGKGNYIKQGTFGDSKIKCHGRCGQYGHWTGELYITTCCK